VARRTPLESLAVIPAGRFVPNPAKLIDSDRFGAFLEFFCSRFDTIVFDRIQLEHLVKLWGAGHVLAGTDYPYDMGMYDPRGFVGGLHASGQTKVLSLSQLLTSTRRPETRRARGHRWSILRASSCGQVVEGPTRVLELGHVRICAYRPDRSPGDGHARDHRTGARRGLLSADPVGGLRDRAWQPGPTRRITVSQISCASAASTFARCASAWSPRATGSRASSTTPARSAATSSIPRATAPRCSGSPAGRAGCRRESVDIEQPTPW
jgi:hypothetical protein